MNKVAKHYRIVPHRAPKGADAPLFRSYWTRQRRSHRPSRKFMRALAHDYWLAKQADNQR